jgi:hypothetical protein
MVMMSNPMHNLVSGAQLPAFVGKNVAVCGVVNNASSGSTSFSLQSTDNVSVPVHLNKPLSEDLKGYVEVHGVCQGGKTIQAENFYTFTNKKFDAKSHNTLCKLMNSIPNVYHNQK